MVIGGGDPKDTNRTPLRNMDDKQFDSFKLKRISKLKTHGWDERQNRNETKARLNKISEPSLSEQMLEGIEPKYLKYKEWREAHSGSYQMNSFNWNWSADRDYYNEHGNLIIFMEVHGSEADDFINMNINTHDIIRGYDGKDRIFAGWGDDILDGGNESKPAADIMRGGDGSDEIFAYHKDWAFGEDDNDRLYGWGNANLYGGQDSDVFEIHNGSIRGKSPSVMDFTQEDKIIVNLIDNSQFTGIHPNNNGTYTIMTSNGPGSVLNVSSLDELDIEVNSNQTRVTITGSEFL